MSKNIALIGSGYWGKNFARVLSELGALAGVCDQNDDTANAIVEQCHSQRLLWPNILKDAQIDAVLLATPPSTHFELAKEALESGKHVFVEKPLSLKVDDAKALCEIAKKAGKILMVGHLLHYHPVFQQLKKMSHEGELGTVRYIYSNRLNFGKIRTIEDCMWSFAPHDISTVLSLANSPVKEMSSQLTPVVSKDLADMATLQLSFENGIRGHIFVSWYHPFKEHKLVVVGDKGMAVFDDTKPWEEKLLHYPHRVDFVNGMPELSKADATPVAVSQKEPLKEECLAFMRAMETGKPPLTDGYEGLAVLDVLEQASESSSQAEKDYFVHESSCIDDDVQIGAGTKIWHYSHILSHTTIGEECTIGQNVSIGPHVQVGKGCKIQNNVSLYNGVTLAEHVFCGPSCVFTNVKTPRSEINRRGEFVPTNVGKGAVIGANATIVCGNTIGEYAMIGAGAVVTKDVPPHALIIGNPGKQVGWVSRSGKRLDESMKCPDDGTDYSYLLESCSSEIKELV